MAFESMLTRAFDKAAAFGGLGDMFQKSGSDLFIDTLGTRRDAMECDGMQCNAMQGGATKCNSLERNATRCTWTQRNLIQYSTMQRVTRCDSYNATK